MRKWKKAGIFLLLIMLISAGIVWAVQEAKPKIPEEVMTFAYPADHPIDVIANRQTGYIYITNGVNRIGIIKGSQYITSLDTDGLPRAMAIDEERGWLYVTNEISDTVHIIEETEIIATLPIGKRPRDVTVNPVTGLAYVISETPGSKPGNYSNQLTVLSGPNIVDTVQFGQDLGALQVMVDPVQEYIYVRMSQGHLIILHDQEEVARLELEYGITKIDVHPQTGDVYVIGGQRLYKFSDRQQVLQTRLVHGNTSLRNMRVHPITGDIYIVQSSEDSGVLVVREFDDHFGVIGRVDTGAATFKMTVDPFTQNVYTASFHHNTVSAIHGTELLATYEVGWYPYGIGVNPANGWVYVSNTNEDTVTILGFPNRIRLPLILNK